jgi:putative salt-induced outer membrane protein YdiY
MTDNTSLTGTNQRGVANSGVASGLAVALTLLIGCGAALAQDKAAATAAAPEPEKKKTWDTTAAAGLTLTRGNSETLLVTLGLDTKRKWDKNEVAAGINGGYGEDKDVKNTEFINGFAQYNRLLNERLYLGLRLDATYDGIAELDYRVRITPLVGYYILKQTNTTLSVEAGPSAVFEKHKGQSEDTYCGLRLGERFEQKISKTTRLWESVDYVPQVDDWTEKYVITGEVGVDAAITKAWSLRVVFQDIYDSAPTAGRDNNDLRLVAGVAFKF